MNDIGENANKSEVKIEFSISNEDIDKIHKCLEKTENNCEFNTITPIILYGGRDTIAWTEDGRRLGHAIEVDRGTKTDRLIGFFTNALFICGAIGFVAFYFYVMWYMNGFLMDFFTITNQLVRFIVFLIITSTIPVTIAWIVDRLEPESVIRA